MNCVQLIEKVPLQLEPSTNCKKEKPDVFFLLFGEFLKSESLVQTQEETKEDDVNVINLVNTLIPIQTISELPEDQEQKCATSCVAPLKRPSYVPVCLQEMNQELSMDVENLNVHSSVTEKPVAVFTEELPTNNQFMPFLMQSDEDIPTEMTGSFFLRFVKKCLKIYLKIYLKICPKRCRLKKDRLKGQTNSLLTRRCLFKPDWIRMLL